MMYVIFGSGENHTAKSGWATFKPPHFCVIGEKMKKSLLTGMFQAWIAVGPLQAQTPAGKPVIKLDPSLDALISPDAKLELVKNDFGFTEGIVWVDQGNSGYLLLSDMYANVIYKLTPDGKASLYLDHSGYTGYDIWRVGMPQPDANRKDVFFMIGSNGLALDRQGRLVIATWSGRSIDRIEKDGKRTILANRYVRRYNVQPDDTLTNSTLLIDMNSDAAPGITDGMKVDTQGNIYESGPG